MLFASTSLARRIERAERRLLEEAAGAVSANRPDMGVVIEPLGGGVAVFTIEGSPLNKIAGLGFDGPLDEGRLEAIEREFARRSAPLQVELSCLADPSIAAALTRRGYVLLGYENVLGRRLPVEPGDLPPIADDIEIVVSDPDDAALWIDVVVTGFISPDLEGVPSHQSFPRELMEGVISDLVASRCYQRYTARRGGVAAGGASLRLGEGVAQMCGAATLPAHRRRGVQTALLARRLDDAARAECDIAVMTALPGSKSHENAQRRGFELLYTRVMLVREP